MSIRLGIIGTGRIAERFAQDGWQGLEVTLHAVYNPHLKSAQDYAFRHKLPIGTDQWPDFIKQIDAAYIASPTAFHDAYIQKLLENGKHVLCEKPMVLRKQRAEELFHLAEQKDLILMEAIKTAYCPGFRELLKVIWDGRIGEVRDVEACFTKLAAPDLRELTDIEYGGSMTELGTYGCYAVLKIMGCDFQNIQFAVQRNPQGIDIFTKTFFEYEEHGKTGLVKSGLGVKSEGTLVVSGTKGYLLAQAPWWLTRHFEIHYEDPNQYDIYDYPFIGNGLQYELEEFLNRIQRRSMREMVTKQESVVLADIMERFLKREAEYRKL